MKDPKTHQMEMIDENNVKICVVGLGYVGLPLARLFSTKFPTVGFDISKSRVEELNAGHDSRLEVNDDLLTEALTKYGLKCTSNPDDIKSCNFFVVAVPTPIDDKNHPDLMPLLSTTRTVGEVLKKGDIVVYESTVYPGVTEDECVPNLEKVSGLTFNKDFYVGYSPERINPGDREHTVEKIKKITSGSTPEVADFVDRIYNSVLVNGTHRAPSIKVAEAAKIIENAQRDVNIAFFNELSKIFNALGIDTNDVIEAAGTKWNFIKMKPGLVGGHCISVDPYYLIQKATECNVTPDLLMAARTTNESMGSFVTARTIEAMNKKGIMVKDSDILILGITFKENCPDVRNTKVITIYNTFREYTPNIKVFDNWADADVVSKYLGIELTQGAPDRLKGKFDAVVLAVAHDDFAELTIRDFLKDPEKGVVYDVKGVMPVEKIDGRL